MDSDSDKKWNALGWWRYLRGRYFVFVLFCFFSFLSSPSVSFGSRSSAVVPWVSVEYPVVEGGKGIPEDIPEVVCIYAESFPFSVSFVP
jgi:hypothetical protein